MNREKKVKIEMGELVKIAIEIVDADETLQEDVLLSMGMVSFAMRLEMRLRDANKFEIEMGELFREAIHAVKDDEVLREDMLLGLAMITFAGKLEGRLFEGTEEK